MCVYVLGVIRTHDWKYTVKRGEVLLIGINLPSMPLCHPLLKNKALSFLYEMLI